MTQTLFLSQLRALLLIVIAYCAGRGWLSPQDSGAITAILVPIGALAGPWIWSIYANINSKLVHADSAAGKVAVIEEAHPVDALNAASRLAEKVAAVILLALMIGSLWPDPASAQVKLGPIAQKLKTDIDAQAAQAKSAVTGQPVVAAPLVCDWSILTKIKPDNLIEIMKTCINTQKQELVDDSQRALDSAKAFLPNPDQDAINCLTPGTALFRAAVPVPAIPAQDAVPATATSPAIPAVAAVPEKEPGLILLFQKYREFVLAGALTSCQTWVNTPVNATISAGAGAAAGAVGAAAILVPK